MVSMIAAGNTLWSTRIRAASGGAPKVRRYNEAIRELGIDNPICLIPEPTMETADALFKHRDVA